MLKTFFRSRFLYKLVCLLSHSLCHSVTFLQQIELHPPRQHDGSPPTLSDLSPLGSLQGQYILSRDGYKGC